MSGSKAADGNNGSDVPTSRNQPGAEEGKTPDPKEHDGEEASRDSTKRKTPESHVESSTNEKKAKLGVANGTTTTSEKVVGKAGTTSHRAKASQIFEQEDQSRKDVGFIEKKTRSSSRVAAAAAATVSTDNQSVSAPAPGTKTAASGGIDNLGNAERSRAGDGPNGKGTSPMEEIVSKYVILPPLPTKQATVSAVTASEKRELEKCLEFSKGETWPDHWLGKMALADRDVYNPDGRSPRERQKKTLFHWAERGKTSLRLLHVLLRFVTQQKETPEQAKKILGHVNPKSIRSILAASRRVCYDPLALNQDGWTTAKSKQPIGASGGPHRIGELVYWQGEVGVVIAYIHDTDLGDLWKAMWLRQFDTFDLEAEELDDAKKKYDRRKQKEASAGPSQASKRTSSAAAQSAKQSSGPDSALTRRSGRYASAGFTVKGIEHGIVLAVSYSRGSRPGVFWPARIMHFSEMKTYGTNSKRGSQKQKVDVVFLAPYWNSSAAMVGSRRTESYSESLSRHGSSIFSAGPLFDLESIDATPETIQEYPYDAARGIDMDQLRASFKFAGLPKAAFSRFVDSHRLALGLKTFSQTVLQSTVASDVDRTTAGLFEAHPLATQTAYFPSAVLHLPFEHILSQLPTLERDVPSSGSKGGEEPSLQFGAILDSMKPPACFGRPVQTDAKSSPEATPRQVSLTPPTVAISGEPRGENAPITFDRFLQGLPSLEKLISDTNDKTCMSALLGENLSQLLSKVPHHSSEFRNLPCNAKRERSKALVNLWIVVKTHGEELIASCTHSESSACLVQWRKACERIYNHMMMAFSSNGFGNGVSSVITDSRCNQHLTSNECIERPVRLPAALKAAKVAGAGKGENIQLLTEVQKKYLEIAENSVIGRAHSKSYLQRIKRKCLSAPDDKAVVSLTEDSDGNGGEDTMGCMGSWEAAIACVGAAVQAVDRIVNGECVNAFCVTRPPGHHAGRELHPMKAVSNGFCLLNSVACAALYGTSPISEGGPGLRRICVIDIDVHHGNGTQDILCSTYDPRFLYVSIHAGGPHVNGVELNDGEEELTHHLGKNPKKGIFPGRCGDTSPHAGVLNIPLGGRVTSHALGAALVSKVSPAVEKFSPELVIISAGFDAHKNDPLGLGGLNAEDFGTLTEVICKLAHKSCSGRVLSVLEGGYGVPCCRPSKDNSDPLKKLTMCYAIGQSESKEIGEKPPSGTSTSAAKADTASKQLAILDLGDDLPPDMEDDIPYLLQKRLDKCHAEGFIESVREHVRTLAKCNNRS